MKTSTEELRRAAEQAIAARGGGQQVESPASALRRFREQVEPEDVLALLERVGRLEEALRWIAGMSPDAAAYDAKSEAMKALGVEE